MAMSPFVLDAAAIAPSRDLNGNATPATATATATATASASASATSASNSPRKTKKTIINWLVNSDNNNRLTCDNPKSSKSQTNPNTNPNHNPNPSPNPNPNPNPNNNCSCESRAFRDFRGVQTLRLLWSKRIKSASEDHAHYTAHSHSHAHAQAANPTLGTLKKLNKSVSCLVNVFNNSRDFSTPEKSLAKRTASLHNLQDSKHLLLQKEKDNFYKYKNAEQARMQAKLKRVNDEATATIVAGENRENRNDMELLSAVDKTTAEQGQAAEDEGEVASRAEAGEWLEEQVELRAKRERNVASDFSLSVTSGRSGCGSSESVHTSTSSTATAATVTSSAGRSGGRRKYSFKTHAGKSYHQHHHPIRRVSNMDAHNSASNGPSLVAKLTQQFNEIIQKDVRLLEQVKRNNGVWLSRGTHVYKVIEREQGNPEENRNSTVQRNIKKFEKLEKPSIPLKTEQLMRKHRELMASSPRGSLNPKGSRVKRNLKLPAGCMGIPEEEMKATTDRGISGIPEQPANLPKDQTPKEEVDARSNEELRLVINKETEGAADEQEPEQEEGFRQKWKHKKSSIYEKLRFPFKGRKSASPSPTKGRAKEEAAIPEEITKEEPEPEPLRLQIPKEDTPVKVDTDRGSLVSPCIEAEAKILDALEVLDQKLKVLSHPSEMSTSGDGELLIAANDDFEQRILPNNSFVFQSANKQISNNQILLNQAVNVTLVNAIEGEQMIMEQKQLVKMRELEEELVEQKPKQTTEKEVEEEQESIYEPITLNNIETKTETQTSSLYKIASKSQEIVEDIYQTLEETKPTNWLEGYESIAGSQEASALAYDGYESFAPEEVVTTPPTPSAGTGTLGRNTRDQLPELPKPKRVLHTSPMPHRPAPPKPDVKESEEDENIYDTIKGCYESVNLKASSASSSSSSNGTVTLTTDAISLTSNCYESILHYKKTRISAGGNQNQAANGGSCIQLSSSGSTLTISSDHKTNSLYESSLAAAGCVIYGSASVGCRSSLGSSSGSRDSGKPRDKRSSIAGSSDNSDAWVDISDGEHGQAVQEPAAPEAQFIV